MALICSTGKLQFVGIQCSLRDEGNEASPDSIQVKIPRWMEVLLPLTTRTQITA